MVVHNLAHCFLSKLPIHSRNLHGGRRSIRHWREISTSGPINCREPKFDKVLIANRGEIACRIISTAKKMGVKTVAVYSIVDAHAKHVKMADEKVLIGGPESSESYLNIERIIRAVRSSGSEAVHPGYGFLSENANFVEALEREGIAFVGPSSEAITRMGDKLESKRLAIEAGVNTVPGFDGIIRDSAHCVEIANEIGYPVMIKASAGGGGKGMRIARNDLEARDGFALAAQEALASFGDNRILLEKYIDNPRHIEIQVLGDKFGNAVHLFERECSIQRRHQKVIEEAPSTFLDDATRSSMGMQAVSLCKKIGYHSAGTVEFLVDQNRNFYFLEMNTRLQVEHPITECITGIDLVEQMLRIAKGNELKLKQDEIKIDGWAIESRIYAEDPYKNFGLPSTGKLYKYQEPKLAKGMRCDSGIQEGCEISIYYDAMISKLIAHAADRRSAIDKTLESLDSYVIRGLKHNIPLIRDILTERNFLRGDIHTNYLSKTYGGKFQTKPLHCSEKVNLVSITAALYAAWDCRNKTLLNGPNLKTQSEWELSIELLEESYDVKLLKTADTTTIRIGDEVFQITNGFNLVNPIIETRINGTPIIMQLLSKCPSGEFKLIYKGETRRLNVLTKRASELRRFVLVKPKIDYSKIIKSPMPGLVKSVMCGVGDFVSNGQNLCIIEAMKMQNTLSSDAEGVVKEVNVKEGDAVSDDDVLIILE
ncbi:PREDICTED: propionyl-CoA carboxylase alpha chain, mitochondrial-like [Nicrophorus vespilloides]|uniref:propionyl-CoA carboxylase n=1 Tax=Nicrophorus vespilloides TaxID=110193 RepID=A0ABM1MKJ2_NICVS|nr:PREDICTED: propionyl-CoA carboxylase alpha chain, mitochondrial-like [Nicrophorus vespilloides]